MASKIKFPLDEEEKERFRKRLNEVLGQKSGVQVIILWDKKKLTDYYQNICREHLFEKIKEAAEDYAKITNYKLLI